MLLIATAIAAASPILEVHATYETCVKEQAVRLGAGNNETADTIIHAVRAVCQPQWTALEQQLPDIPGLVANNVQNHSILAHWQENAENAATAALLDARAKRPEAFHSVP